MPLGPTGPHQHNHIMYICYIHKMGLVDYRVFRLCLEEDETAAHLLLWDYDALAYSRVKQLRLAQKEFPKLPLKDIMGCIKDLMFLWEDQTVKARQ